MVQLPSGLFVYVDIGTSSIMQPVPVVEENEDCLRLGWTDPVQVPTVEGG